MSENIVSILLDTPEFEPKKKRNSFLYLVILCFIKIRIQIIEEKMHLLRGRFLKKRVGYWEYHHLSCNLLRKQVELKKRLN